MAYDPYISPNQAVVSGSVAADGENTTDAPSGKKVKGQLVPGTAEVKKAKADPAPEPTPEPKPEPTPAPAEPKTEAKAEPAKK